MFLYIWNSQNESVNKLTSISSGPNQQGSEYCIPSGPARSHLPVHSFLLRECQRSLWTNKMDEQLRNQKQQQRPDVMGYIYNSNIQDARPGGWQVWGLPGLWSKTLSENITKMLLGSNIHSVYCMPDISGFKFYKFETGIVLIPEMKKTKHRLLQ